MVNQYSAAQAGAQAMEAFVVAGGKFNDKPNVQGNTSSHIVALHGNTRDIETFNRVGGRFSEKPNQYGLTPGHLIAEPKEEIVGRIKAFSAAKGKFTDEQDSLNRNTPGHLIASNRNAKAIETFAVAGGIFSDKQNVYGSTPGHIVAMNGNAETIKAFAEAGGKFSDTKDQHGRNAGDYAANSSEKLKAYLEVGGPLPSGENARRTIIALANGELLDRVAKLVADNIKSAFRPAELIEKPEQRLES